MNFSWTSKLKYKFDHCTEVRFAIFLSGGFTTMAVINPPERKLAKRTSVHCTDQKATLIYFLNYEQSHQRWKILIFKVIFQYQNHLNTSKNGFIFEYQSRKHNFYHCHFLINILIEIHVLKLCPIFVSSVDNFGNRYKKFPLSKFLFGLDAQPWIQILNELYIFVTIS